MQDLGVLVAEAQRYVAQDLHVGALAAAGDKRIYW